MMWAYLVVHSISAPAGPRVELTPSFFWQGGGISVSTESKATLIDSNVYQNKATNVCLLSEPFKTFLPSRGDGGKFNECVQKASTPRQPDSRTRWCRSALPCLG